jgi:hypothetical protein
MLMNRVFNVDGRDVAVEPKTAGAGKNSARIETQLSYFSCKIK